jgi:hypothetical protein
MERWLLRTAPWKYPDRGRAVVLWARLCNECPLCAISSELLMSPRNFSPAGKMGLAGGAGGARLPHLRAHCKFHDIGSSVVTEPGPEGTPLGIVHR